jgi:hypothetical protein
MDIRVPIGLTFLLMGLALAGFGLLWSDPAIYHRSLGININLWWGLVLAVFGAGMLVMGVRRVRKARKVQQTAAEVT